jgi:ribose transport system substrate-binding protein
MMFTQRISERSRAGHLLTGLAVLVAALLVAPIGSGSTRSKQAAPAGAQALVTQAMQANTTWIGPTSSPPLATGKTIGVIPCATFVEGCNREAKGVIAAAKAAGWKTIEIDGKVSPATEGQGIDSLISQHVDAIVLNSINASSVGSAMAHAKAAHIPVIVSFAQDPAPFGGIGDVRIDDTQAGKVIGAYMAANGGGNVIAVYDSSAQEVVERYQGLKAALAQYGNGKIVSSQAIEGTQIGPSESGLMSSLLQKYPKGQVNWVFCGYDFLCVPLIQEIQRAHRTEIKATGYDGNLQNLGFIRGGQVQAAAVGYPLEWAGWAAVDDLNRYFNKQPLWPGTKYFKFRLLTKANLPPAGQSYTGDLNYQAKFKQLWKIQ